MDIQTKLKIAGESSAALLKTLGTHTIAMVDISDDTKPLSSGVLVRICDRILIATARHCVPRDMPTGKLWIMPSVPKSPDDGMIGFVRSVRHPNLDLAILEITQESLNEYLPSKKPIELSRIALLGSGQQTRPMGVCGCPLQFCKGEGTYEDPGRAALTFYTTGILDSDLFPEVPQGERPADPDTDIFYEYATEGQVLKTEQMIELTHPRGFSGGGVWDLGFEQGKIWSTDESRLFGIQSTWLESARYVRAIQIHHWLRLVADEFPQECSNAITEHFPSLANLNKIDRPTEEDESP